MASIIRFRRGTTAQHQTFTGLMGEITIDITKKTVVAHDGVTPGGSPLLTETVFNQFAANTYNKTQVDQLIADIETELGNVTLANVAFTGNYSDLNNTPAFANVALSGQYADLNGKPVFHPVAISGSYGDLSGKPALANVATSGSYLDLTNRPTLANVAITGNYNDLINKPEFDGNIYVTQSQLVSDLSNYATTSTLNNYVLTANILAVGTLAGLASQVYVNQQDDLLANLINTKANQSSLSNYVTTSDLTNTLTNYVTVTTLSSTLSGYITDTTFNNTLSNYVTGSSLTSTLGNYVTTTDLNAELNNYVTSSSLTTTLEPYAQVSSTPSFEEGQPGDKKGMMAFDNDYLYICVADWQSPGTATIWRRIAWYDTIIGS